MKHVLVVGGSGMLADVSLWLNNQGYHVSVIARNPHRLKKLIDKVPHKNKITAISVDYNNDEWLRKEIISTVIKNGKIDTVIAWIHSYAENALEIICKEVSNGRNEWNLFHVLGSRSNLIEIQKNVPISENCSYHQVQLGFILEDSYSRWLTDQEISEGVIESISKNKKLHIVGNIEPWDKRPS